MTYHKAMFTMYHYWQENPDGSVHIQNALAGQLGQHHVKTKAQFRAWVKKHSLKDYLKPLKGVRPCECGLKVGETREGEKP